MLTRDERWQGLSDDAKEMLTLLDLVNAEWQSDPMSVQCFDLRIVGRVDDLVKKYS